MIKVGEYNLLKVMRKVEFGVYLADGGDGILLPKRFVPPQTKPGDEVNVFLYHDSENRLVATTQQPKAMVGEVALLEAVSVTHQGAFLDWGLMKDVFVPKSQQLSSMRTGGRYLVRLYLDEQTGRVAATEKIESFLRNETLTIKENEEVDLVVYRRSDVGYMVAINGLHSGLLYFNEVYTDLEPGDRLKGFVRKIRPDNKIDVIAGKRGYDKVEEETGKILRLLKANNGHLPYNDRSAPEDIYRFFGMSKKTFKMTTGNLFRSRKILFTSTGIQLVEQV